MASALIEELRVTNGIDVEGALERMGGEEEIFETVLGMFLADENYGMLKDALAAGDEEHALGYAHTLKGLCGNLGFMDLFRYSDDMVETFRKTRNGDIPLLTKQIDEEYARITGILSKYL